MNVSAVQFLKALHPMLVTLLGIVTDVRPLQPLNAELPMLVTPCCMTTRLMYVLQLYHGDLES